MARRCFLFSSDEGTATLIRQILADLGVEGESCSDAVVAAEKITNQAFQIVIIDWDKQPEAGLLLNTARERKAAERPLTLAIVSDDQSVPESLQAGANSVLRKPIVAAQAKDTLTTACELLRAKQESAAGLTHVAAAGASSSGQTVSSSSLEPGQKILRAGEFLQTPTIAPGGQFETEADVVVPPEGTSSEPVDALKNLEPVAASVAEKKPEATPAPAPTEGRGLEWYLKTKVANRPAPAQAEPVRPRANPELVGYDQITSYSPPPTKTASVETAVSSPPTRTIPANFDVPKDEQKKEAELFAYIDGAREEPEQPSQARSGLGKRAIIGALVLAGCAMVAAPQAPWHPKLRALWVSGKQTMHAWLNPQPVTPAPTPATHEDLGNRAGDEYKLPVAENIPDATTDPSQIKVLPVIDPTAKKPNADGTGPDQTPASADGSTAAGSDQPQTPVTETPENPQNPPAQSQPVQSQPSQSQPSPVPTPPMQPARGPASLATIPSPGLGTASASPGSHPGTAANASPVIPSLAPANSAYTVSTPSNVPSSLKSQLTSMTPEASGNKPLDAALPSIEPVDVTEAAERGLLTDQPAIAYPANGRGQQGTVVVQVLVGRDGTVRDVKFVQGSLVFARAATDGVKQWKFKPYLMNGRPVSVQTLLTLKFKPGQ